MKAVMKWSFILSLCWMPVAGLSTAPSSAEVEQLMRLSGTQRQLEQVPALIVSGFEQARSQGAPLSEADLAIMVTAAQRAYMAEHFLNKVRKALQTGMTRADVNEMLIWYRSELGQRISAAEVSASTVEASEAMWANPDALLADEERVALAARLDTLLDLTPMLVTMQEYQSEAVYTAIVHAMAPGHPINLDGYRAQVASQRGALEAQTRQLLLVSGVYTYRDIDLASLLEYEQELAKPVARSFNRLVAEAIIDGYKETTRHFAAEVGRVLIEARQQQ